MGELENWGARDRRLEIRDFAHLPICSFAYLLTCSFALLLICSLAHLLTCSLVDLLYRPLRVCSDHGFVVVEGVLQDREGVCVGGVAEGDGDVSQVAASFGAGDGSPLEALIKGLGSESQFARRRGKRLAI